MKKSPIIELEKIVRSQESINFNAVIYEVFQDTVNAKMPPGSKKIKRNVRLAEHIKAKRHLLKPGIPCQIELRQNLPYVIAIFEEGIDAQTPIPFVEDSSGTTGGTTLPPIATQTPRPTATINCQQGGWIVTWSAITGAVSYEIFWSADNTTPPSGDPYSTTTSTQVSIAFDTADPPKTYFAIRAVDAQGNKSPYSPWVTDALALQAPLGFTACPVPGGYRINVNLQIDPSHTSPAFDHWELQWANDDQGASAETIRDDLIPDDLPLFISSQAPGDWTFDSSEDESWPKAGQAGAEWNSDGNTAAGSRVVYNGSGLGNDGVDPSLQWFQGSIEQVMNQFTGSAGDTISLYVKVIRSSGSGSFSAKAHLNAGVFRTTIVGTPGGSIEEYQYDDYAIPPYTYVDFDATGDWQLLTLTLPTEAIGRPVGYLRVTIKVQGVPLDSILADDIHWGPGGIQPAQQKWFRLRAITCAGLASEWTEWKSGWADLIIFEKPDYHGNINPFDSRQRYRCASGKLYYMNDGLTYTDITGNIPDPSNEVGDDPAPTAGEVEYIQALPDPFNDGIWYFLVTWKNDILENRGWILKRDEPNDAWFWHGLGYGFDASPDCAGFFFDEDLEGWSIDGSLAGTMSFGGGQAAGATLEWSETSSVSGTGWMVHLMSDVSNFFSYIASPNISVLIGPETELTMRVSNTPTNWIIRLKFSGGGSAEIIAQGTRNAGLQTDIYDLSDYQGSVVTRVEIMNGNGGGIFSVSFDFICFTNAVILAPTKAALPIWMDITNDGEELAVTVLSENVIKLLRFQTSEVEFSESAPETDELNAATDEEVEQKINVLYPRYINPNELILYGHVTTDVPKVVFMMARTEEGEIITLLDEDSLPDDWFPQSYIGAAVLAPPNQLLLIRHATFVASILSIDGMDVVYQLPDTNQELESTLRPGQLLFNQAQGESVEIDSLNLGADTVTLIDDAPLTWVEGDVIFALTVAELWSMLVDNITEITEPLLLIDDIPLTVLPDNLALNRSGVLILGNQIDDTVMLERSERPYASVVDVTGDYVVGDGIVALKWAESGCEEETANIGNENQPPVPPPPPGSSGSGNGGGGTPIIIPPPPGTNQPPTTRPLRHDELIELLDDDHPQYAKIENAVMDGDPAGGVLSGTYPNPGFANDMATQAELDAHINDATDAHDASAISVITTNFDNNLSSADNTVQKALETLDQLASSGGNVWPKPGKANIGTTEYASFAAANAAAIAGDVIRLGDGDHACNNISLVADVHLELSLNARLVQTNDANCLTMSSTSRAKNLRIAVNINSSNDRYALVASGDNFIDGLTITGSNSGSGVLHGVLSATSNDPTILNPNISVEGYGIYLNNSNTIVTLILGFVFGGFGSVGIGAGGYIRAIYPQLDLSGAYPASRGMRFPSGGSPFPSIEGTLYLLDSTTLSPINVPPQSSPPSLPNLNDIYLDDGTNTGNGQLGWRWYNGSSWEAVGGSGMIWMPLTTVVDGKPVLVWDENDNLIATGSTT